MIVLCLLSTKGGTGKTTTAANLGGFVADAGLRVLLIDADVQPTLSSYFHLCHRAAAGLYELLTQCPQNVSQLISHTAIDNLDLVLSNDHLGQLHSLLLHAPDGRLRLRNLLPSFQAHYDLVLIDTQGARSVLLEMAVLASSIVLSPVTPEVLAARELHRGTVQLMRELSPYRHLGIEPPPLSLLVNRLPTVSTTAGTRGRGNSKCEHGPVRCTAGARHCSAHSARKSDLVGDRPERERMDEYLHLSEDISASDLVGR